MVTEVIRVYNTEANAITGGKTGQIGYTKDSGTDVDSNGSCISNNTNKIPYYVYTKYFYRIESNDAVSEFHIDWDDGEDNSPEKANIQVIKLDPPGFFIVVEHIYTESSRFFPLIRAKSTSGFLSKWYTNDQLKIVLAEIRKLGGNPLVEPLKGGCWEKSGRNVTNPNRKHPAGGNGRGTPCHNEHIHIDIPEDFK